MSTKYYPYKKEGKPNLRPLYFEYFNQVCEPALYKFMQTRATGQEANEHNVSIEIKIDGIEVDPEQFFNHYFEKLNALIEMECDKRLKERTTEKLQDIICQINDISDKVCYLNNGISYE